MNAVTTSAAARPAYPGGQPSRRAAGWAVVVGVHLLIGYALVTGTARKGLEFLQKPLQAVVIQEVTIAPPPAPTPPPIAKEVKAVKEVKAPQQALPAQPQQAPPPSPLPFLPTPESAAPTSEPTLAATQVLPAGAAPRAAAEPTAAPTPAPAKPKSAEIGVVCPNQAKPDMPKRAIQEGTEGVVRAQALISNGSVKEVTILSGPRVFHGAVRQAMLQYRCDSSAQDLLATQEFVFKVQ